MNIKNEGSIQIRQFCVHLVGRCYQTVVPVKSEMKHYPRSGFRYYCHQVQHVTSCNYSTFINEIQLELRIYQYLRYIHRILIACNQIEIGFEPVPEVMNSLVNKLVPIC